MKRIAIYSMAAATLTLGGCSERSTPLSPAPTANATRETGQAMDDDADTDDASASERTYRVTIENLTTGQVFSPGVIATHTKKVQVWHTGAPASDGIRQIAEDGSEVAAVAALSSTAGVYTVRSTLAPINRIGGQAPFPTSRSYVIGARGSANRLSVAVMIICTNDGFTGLDGVKLPGGFKAESHVVGAWDAGTEENNERFSQIVDPCGGAGPVPAPPDGNGRVATNGVIEPHHNIQGNGDLSVALHGWRGAVARITVQRMK